MCEYSIFLWQAYQYSSLRPRSFDSVFPVKFTTGMGGGKNKNKNRQKLQEIDIYGQKSLEISQNCPKSQKFVEICGKLPKIAKNA